MLLILRRIGIFVGRNAGITLATADNIAGAGVDKLAFIIIDGPFSRILVTGTRVQITMFRLDIVVEFIQFIVIYTVIASTASAVTADISFIYPVTAN